MATPEIIPDTHHVARYVPKRLQVRDVEDRLQGVFPEAFELAAEKNGYPEEWLSTTWLEFFQTATSRDEQCVCVMNAMKTTGFEPKRSGALAILSVGRLIQNGRACLLKLRLRVLHEPKLGKGNPAYAPVRGYKAGCPKDVIHDVFVVGACVQVLEVGKLPPPS